MKQGLSLKFSQNLSLTPQLQLAIKLLQLSQQELQETLVEQVENNPFLELAPPTANMGLNGAGALYSPASGVDHSAAGMQETALPISGAEHLSELGPGVDTRIELGPATDWDQTGSGGDDGYERNQRAFEDANDEPRQWAAALPLSLLAHLQQQARLLRLAPAISFVLDNLLETLTPEGYLEASAEQVCQDLATSLELDLDQVFCSAFDHALLALRRMDPPGIGAQDLAHCLILQLQHPCPADCVLDAKLPVYHLALKVLQEGFDLLAQRDRAGLKKRLLCDDQRLQDSLALIRQLTPKPGLAFAPPATEYVQAEIIVIRSQGAWQARLNPAVVPPLRVQETHAKFLKRGTATNDNTSNLQQQLSSARQFVRTLQQHFETVYRVGQAIVAAQQAFFEQGAIKLKPMVLRDIADSLGLHESTVSRVTTRKYLQTPQGVLEMKYFFSSGIEAQDGENASSTAIKAYLLDLLKGEPAHKPLSDQALADALNAQGLNVARRTVAKYREQLGFASAHARKPL